jgi:hypothetical protein
MHADAAWATPGFSGRMKKLGFHVQAMESALHRLVSYDIPAKGAKRREDREDIPLMDCPIIVLVPFAHLRGLRDRLLKTTADR